MEHVYWVINEYLAGRCGPAKQPWDLLELRTGGVGAIISLDDEGVEPDAITGLGIRHLPVYQPMSLLTNEADRQEFLLVMPEILRFLDQCRESRIPALIHCYHGCDRTGAVLGCYLVAREMVPAPQAIAWVRDANPDAYGAPGYAETVFTFEMMYRQAPWWFEPKQD